MAQTHRKESELLQHELLPQTGPIRSVVFLIKALAVRLDSKLHIIYKGLT